MGASIHIKGTGSSVVDTIFVCRSHGKISARWVVNSAEGIAGLVREDIARLRAGNVTPTRGDMRCLIFGHIIRMAIWRLRKSWDRTMTIEDRFLAVTSQTQRLGGLKDVERCLGDDFLNAPMVQSAIVREGEAVYRASRNEVSF